MDLALNNLQWLMCHKIQQNSLITICFVNCSRLTKCYFIIRNLIPEYHNSWGNKNMSKNIDMYEVIINVNAFKTSLHKQHVTEGKFLY